MVNKESLNPLINALGTVSITTVVYLFAGRINALPNEQKVALFLGLVIAAIVIQYIVDYLKNKFGINALAIMKKAEQFKKEQAQQQPAPAPAPAPVEPAYDIVQTKFGVFKRNRLADAVGTYFGKADFGKGAADAVYIDIEFWKAAGGRQIKTASIPENMAGLYPVVSRLGTSTDGVYSKNGNLIFGLTDDIFATAMAEEEKQRNLLKQRTVAAYNKWKGLEGTANAVGMDKYDAVLAEVAAAGLTMEQLIALMQK